MTQHARGSIRIGYRPDLVSPGYSCWLNHFRWIAAFAVAAAHLRNLLMPDVDALPAAVHLSLPAKAFYFVTLFGEQAVAIFFVLSGLLVGGTLVRRMKQGTFSPANYTIDRLSRLLVVLIPALVLSVALQHTYQTTTCDAPDSLPRIFGNLAFLQNFTSTPLCNNHPLWSLSSEAWFYVVGPALAIALSRRSIISTAVLIATLAPGILVYHADLYTPLFGLLLWLAGLLPWFVRIALPAWALLIVFLIALLISRLHILGPELDLLVISYSFALFLCADSAKWKKFGGKFANYAAGFSYSLYLVHMPLEQMIRSHLGSRVLYPNTAFSFEFYALALSGVLIISLVFGKAFEDNTPVVRRLLHRLFRQVGLAREA